jgi:L-seryl-tRNA(Ser) seleniumtransferase
MHEQLKQLPQIQTLLETTDALDLIQRFGRSDVVSAVRARLQDVREAILEQESSGNRQIIDKTFFQDVASNLEGMRENTLKPAINATGILIHTNMGRARLAPEAAQAMLDIATRYSTLELDIASGARGTRQDHVEAMICRLTGAESALVVNNCAAAIMTCLTALASGRDVVASRGELVEIGGSFRMPDVIHQSGAKLREVGATNKTRIADYENAICDETAVLLKSHTSNYKIVGFSSMPSRQEVAELSDKAGLVFVEDLGSGVLIDLAPYGLPDEPVVRDVLEAGVDLVTFSGDKLLGGPQAGIIVGRRDLLDRIKKHPIARAVRIDKFSLAALQATLNLYIAPNKPAERIPVLQALSEPLGDIFSRAEALKERLRDQNGLDVKIIETKAFVGGGSLPMQDLSSFAVALKCSTLSADQMSHHLRNFEVPIVGRISQGQLLLDMRAVDAAEIEMIASAVLSRTAK